MTARSDLAGAEEKVARWWKRTGSSARAAEARTGYLFVLPIIALLVIFTLYPVVRSFYISFYHWDPFLHDVYFVGLSNYYTVLAGPATPAHPSFDFALLNVLYYTAVVVSAQTLAAFALALLFNSRRMVSRVTRAIVFIPAATSSVAMSALFIWIFSYQGPVNAFLAPLRIAPQNWFQSTTYAFPAVMAMNVFSTAPYFMILFLAGLQAIPTSIQEAASLDGVRSLWHRTRYIYFPMLRFTTIIVAILGITGAMQLFDQIFVITGGGPAGSTYVPLFYIYDLAFTAQGEQGVAAAASVILFIIIMAITLTQRRFLRELSWAG